MVFVFKMMFSPVLIENVTIRRRDGARTCAFLSSRADVRSVQSNDNDDDCGYDDDDKYDDHYNDDDCQHH